MATETVLVSGGSRGLGAHLVSYYLEKGFLVATFSRTKTDFITSMENDPTFNKRFYWCSASLTDLKSLKTCVRAVFERFGSIDMLINNAAIVKEGLLISTKSSDISEVLNANLLGSLELTKQCLKVMSIKGKGKVIFISSIVGFAGVSGLAAYSATKAAIPGIVKALTREYASLGIRFNAVAPGYLDTEMTKQMSEQRRQGIIRKTPVGRLAVTDDIVKMVYFLTSPDADFINGQTIVVDGGYSA